MIRDGRWTLDKKLFECQEAEEKVRSQLEQLDQESREVSFHISGERAVISKAADGIPGARALYQSLQEASAEVHEQCSAERAGLEQQAAVLQRDSAALKLIQ